MKFSELQYAKIHLTLLISNKITNVEAITYAVVSSLTARNIHNKKKNVYPSITEIAKFATNGYKSNAKRALNSLVKLGLLRESKVIKSGMKLTNYVILDVPDWLIEEGHTFPTTEVKSKNRRRDDVEKGNHSDYPNSKNEDDKWGNHSDYRRGNHSDSEKGNRHDYPLIDLLDHNIDLNTDDRQFPENQTSDFTDDDEELELNHDGDSVEINKKVYEEKNQKQLRRMKKPRVKKRAPSNSSFQETPSLRWEFTKQDSKPVNQWTAIDLIGYWVNRYKKMMKRESEEFFVEDVNCKKIKKYLGITRLYCKKHYNGKFISLKERIDSVFDNAVISGSNVKVHFAYYFTPSNRSTLDSVYNGTYGSKSKDSSSLSNINDNMQWDDEEEEKKAIENLRRNKMKDVKKFA